MLAKSTDNKKGIYLFIIALVSGTLFLNLDFLQLEPLALWARLMPPMLVVLGLVGSVYGIKPLRFAGWVGIVAFLLVFLLASFPSEDYLLGGRDTPRVGMPRTVSNTNTLVRVVVGLVITILLVQRYRRLQTRSNKVR